MSERALDEAEQRVVLRYVEWLRSAGVSTDQIGRALGMTGRVAGIAVERLLEIRDVIERARRRYPGAEDLAAWLVTPRGADGITPLLAMERGDFELARYLAISVPSARVRPSAPQRTGMESAVVREQRQVAVRPNLDEKLAALHSDADDGEETDGVMHYAKTESPFDGLARHALQEHRAGLTRSLEEITQNEGIDRGGKDGAGAKGGSKRSGRA